MSIYLDEFSYDPALVAKGWNEITTTKNDAKEAEYKLHALSGKLAFMSCSEPKLTAMADMALRSINDIVAMKQNGASCHAIYTRAEETSSLLKKAIQEHEQSKVGSVQARADYSLVSDRVDAKFKDAKINSAPLNFSNTSQQPPMNKSGMLDAGPKSIDLGALCSTGCKGTFGYKPEVYSGELRSGLVGLYKADCTKVVRFLPRDAIVFMLERNPSIAAENRSSVSGKLIIEKMATHFAGQKMPGSNGILGSNVRHVLHQIKQDLGITNNRLTDLEPVLEQALNQCHFDEPERK